MHYLSAVRERGREGGRETLLGNNVHDGGSWARSGGAACPQGEEVEVGEEAVGPRSSQGASIWCPNEKGRPGGPCRRRVFKKGDTAPGVPQPSSCLGS